MTIPPPDGSRDRRIEDPTNLWLIHPAGRALLPLAVARGVSANMVSIAGLMLGIGAAAAYAQWTRPEFALLGLVLSVGWLMADGLDGMVARATGTASEVGRILDGLCDHGVFVLIYLVLATSIGTLAGWALAITAGVAHAVQSSLYEGERGRFHRRIRRLPRPATAHPSRSAAVRLYDSVAGSMERRAGTLDSVLEAQSADRTLLDRYTAGAIAPMRLMRLLSANTRVAAIFLACLAGSPALFWWFEIVPLTLVLVAGLAWHRRVETEALGTGPSPSLLTISPQGHHRK
jgi:hypothetical protein